MVGMSDSEHETEPLKDAAAEAADQPPSTPSPIEDAQPETGPPDTGLSVGMAICAFIGGFMVGICMTTVIVFVAAAVPLSLILLIPLKLGVGIAMLFSRTWRPFGMGVILSMFVLPSLLLMMCGGGPGLKNIR
jgi:hypothetical protein